MYSVAPRADRAVARRARRRCDPTIVRIARRGNSLASASEARLDRRHAFRITTTVAPTTMPSLIQGEPMSGVTTTRPQPARTANVGLRAPRPSVGLVCGGVGCAARRTGTVGRVARSRSTTNDLANLGAGEGRLVEDQQATGCRVGAHHAYARGGAQRELDALGDVLFAKEPRNLPPLTPGHDRSKPHPADFDSRRAHAGQFPRTLAPMTSLYGDRGDSGTPATIGSGWASSGGSSGWRSGRRQVGGPHRDDRGEARRHTYPTPALAGSAPRTVRHDSQQDRQDLACRPCPPSARAPSATALSVSDRSD